MMAAQQIGFVVLSHRDPPMLKRLIRRLTRDFDDPPIVCHHDFHQTPLRTSEFPANVHFIKKPIRTRWAGITVVQAFLLALRELYDWAAPDWYIHLSGNDYPIKPARLIRQELSQSSYDAFLNHHRVTHNDLPKGAFFSDSFVRAAYDRYVATRVPVPHIPRLLREKKLTMGAFPLRHPTLTRRGPFSDGSLTCFAGDAWVTARERCARILLSELEGGKKLLNYYSRCHAPDESIFQTVLCNRSELKFCSDNKRYADWSIRGPHPKGLGVEDLPKMLSSNAHFARKFPDSRGPVLDELDRIVAC